MTVRLARAADAGAIADIYAPYVEGSAISLEDSAPDVAEMERRIAAGGDLYPWLAAEADGRIIGFASASRFRPRHGYRFTAETSVYVSAGAHGNGIGRALYSALFELLIKQGFCQAIAAVTLPNEGSVQLHERFGFEPCGVYRQVGWKLGRWWDVGLWQRSLASAQTPPKEPEPFAQFIAGRQASAAGPPSRSGR